MEQYRPEVKWVGIALSTGSQALIFEGSYAGSNFTYWAGWAGYGQTEIPDAVETGVSLGDFHGCGLKGDGGVACWGAKQPDTDSSRTDFGQTDALAGKFVSLAAGARHSCGLKADGTIECWGDVPGTNPPA